MFPRHFPLEQLFEWVAGSKKKVTAPEEESLATAYKAQGIGPVLTSENAKLEINTIWLVVWNIFYCSIYWE